MSYWGQPADRDSEGHLAQRWKVRRVRRRDGRLSSTPLWDTYEPDGTWSGIHESWDEAMVWATSLASRVEHWLEHQR